MEYHTQETFRIWEKNRQLYLGYLDNYSLEQLNKVPEGFNNNLIWNVAHVVVAQQVLLYKKAGLEGYLPEWMYPLFRPGTKPEKAVTDEELEEIRFWLLEAVGKLKEDLEKGIFESYTGFTTSMGFVLNDFEAAFQYNNYHEGMHLGTMMAMRKLV